MKKTKGKSDKPQESKSPEKYRRVLFRTNAGGVVLFEADSPEGYDQANEVIDAGFRLQNETAAWGMGADDYWKLSHFPWDEDDWKLQMERLDSHSLHDENASDLLRLMDSCSSTIEKIWKWLHHLAEHAQNSNIKGEAGRTLGKLYYEAGQKKSRMKLGTANKEFKRQIAPFGSSGAKPAKALVDWVYQQMTRQLELWKRAIEVARRFQEKRSYYEYCHSGRYSQRTMTVVGIHPMNSMEEAWKGYLTESRKREGTGWINLLNSLENHPFCKAGLTLEQLINFDACWNEAFEPVLRQQWAKLSAQEKRGIGKDLSFEHRLGTVKDPNAGYWVAKDFFDRFFLPRWEQFQKHDQYFKESMRRVNLGTGTAVDPVAKKILAKVRK